jgi:hypothetical protein
MSKRELIIVYHLASSCSYHIHFTYIFYIFLSVHFYLGVQTISILWYKVLQVLKR